MPSPLMLYTNTESHTSIHILIVDKRLSWRHLDRPQFAFLSVDDIDLTAAQTLAQEMASSHATSPPPTTAVTLMRNNAPGHRLQHGKRRACACPAPPHREWPSFCEPLLYAKDRESPCLNRSHASHNPPRVDIPPGPAILTTSSSANSAPQLVLHDLRSVSPQIISANTRKTVIINHPHTVVRTVSSPDHRI